MHTVYCLRANELDNQFLGALTLLKDKTIEIIVADVDETANYLLHSDANRYRLLQAIEHVSNGENLVKVELDTL